MKITVFEVSDDRSFLNLIITDASTTTSLVLWTKDTYKDYSKAIDLSSKLTGADTETIIITPLDISQVYLDGVYFIETWGDDLFSSGVTSELTRYKECILGKLVNILPESGCLKIKDDSLMNAQTLLLSLEDAIEGFFIDEIMIIIKALDLYCSNECRSCKEYSPIVNPNYYSS